MNFHLAPAAAPSSIILKRLQQKQQPKERGGNLGQSEPSACGPEAFGDLGSSLDMPLESIFLERMDFFGLWPFAQILVWGMHCWRAWIRHSFYTGFEPASEEFLPAAGNQWGRLSALGWVK